MFWEGTVAYSRKRTGSCLSGMRGRYNVSDCSRQSFVFHFLKKMLLHDINFYMLSSAILFLIVPHVDLQTKYYLLTGR